MPHWAIDYQERSSNCTPKSSSSLIVCGLSTGERGLIPATPTAKRPIDNGAPPLFTARGPWEASPFPRWPPPPGSERPGTVSASDKGPRSRDIADTTALPKSEILRFKGEGASAYLGAASDFLPSLVATCRGRKKGVRWSAAQRIEGSPCLEPFHNDELVLPSLGVDRYHEDGAGGGKHGTRGNTPQP